MSGLIGYLVQGRVDFGTKQVWVRLGLVTSPESDIRKLIARSGYCDIAETRISPYYRVDTRARKRRQAVATRAVCPPVNLPGFNIPPVMGV